VDYIKYKIDIDKSNQVLSCDPFQRKSVKWWRKVFIHLFNLCVINVHVLHSKRNRKKSDDLFFEVIAEGLFSDAGEVVQEQSWSISAGKLTGRDQFPYRILETQIKSERTVSVNLQSLSTQLQTPNKNCKEAYI
jgi:hypothetical protein